MTRVSHYTLLSSCSHYSNFVLIVEELPGENLGGPFEFYQMGRRWPLSTTTGLESMSGLKASGSQVWRNATEFKIKPFKI